MESNNRIESWLSQSRSNRWLLWSALALGIFALDSLLAVGLVVSGAVPPHQLFVTKWLRQIPSLFVDIPELRNVLPRGPHIYPNSYDRLEFDGLLGADPKKNYVGISWAGRSGFSPDDRGFFASLRHWDWFVTNEQGFPPVDQVQYSYSIPKPADIFRVVMLGGSTVQGWGVNNPLESLPAKLQAELNDALAQHPAAGIRRIELINAGVANFTSDQEYLHLLADILPFQPDLVLAYDGWNDALEIPKGFTGHGRARPYRTEWQEGNADRLNRGAFLTLLNVATETLGGFATFNRLNKLVGLLTSKSERSTTNVYQPAHSEEAAKFYILNRERMLFLAQQNGFRFASILQPVMAVDNKPYSALEKMADATLSEDRRTKLTVFYGALRPLLTAFAGVHESVGHVCIADISLTSFADNSETVYFDHGHLGPRGNQIVAKQIVGELKRCKVLPTSIEFQSTYNGVSSR